MRELDATTQEVVDEWELELVQGGGYWNYQTPENPGGGFPDFTFAFYPNANIPGDYVFQERHGEVLTWSVDLYEC